MGDGSTETGPDINHVYNILSTEQDYKIMLTATNENGCINSASKTVDIVPFIPNVFTPNEDRVNDLLMPGMEFEIYDRYGVLIYKGKDGWTGRYKGQMMDNDSYFFLIHYTDKYNQVQTRKGKVTLKK